MVKTLLRILKPKNFNFQRTVLSHGWYALPPFALDRENWILTRVFSLETRPPVAAEIHETAAEIEITVNGEIDENEREKILRDARHILRLDDDFEAFYALVKKKKDFSWIAESGAGRLLRSPTVFEDLVKTLATTNCSWALTKKMIGNLVETLGEVSADGGKSFPQVEKMAEQSVDFYKNEIRAGYRAPYFLELAEKVASGTLDVESWAQSEMPTGELKKQLKNLKGFGDYAAENMLKLLGRYDGLALDSFLRAEFAKKHNGGAACEDRQIRTHYQKFGDWQGLALWCDMTKEWL